MNKRKFASGGEAEAMAQMQRDKAIASGAAVPSIPNTPNAGENTGVKTATVGDEVSKPMSPAEVQTMIGPAPSRSLPDKRFSPRGRSSITREYAKGGSVKGSGCEQRGLRKCKVV
jgi:hypothetical protein